jgi:hypothetical protein
MGAQEFERARAVDAGVLDFVEQHDRGVADDRRVGDQQRARLPPPDSSVIRLESEIGSPVS